MRRLPVLEDIRIATPCSADWDDMSGTDTVRHCGKCEKNVYNLSAMTRVDAEKLVAAREGRTCVRFYQRDDGTMLTTDCPVGVERKRLRARIWARVSGAAASLALLVGLAGGRARADVSVTDGGSDGKAAQPKRREFKGEVEMMKPPPSTVEKGKKPPPHGRAKQGGLRRPHEDIY